MVAFVAVAACVVPADLPSRPPTAVPTAGPLADSGSDDVVLVGETSDGSHGCFGGDLAAYAIPGGLRQRRAVQAIGGGVVSLAASAAFYLRTTVDGPYWRTIIERIDLRTGGTTMEIDAGAGIFGNDLYAQPHCHAWLNVSPDGTTLALARPGVEGLPGRVQVDLFDARSGQRVATRQLNAKAGGTADVTMWMLARERIFVTLHSYLGCGSGTCSSASGEEHIELDARLTQRGSSSYGCGRAQVGPGGILVAMCGTTAASRPSIKTFTGAGELRGSIALGLDTVERIMGWRMTTDGLAVVLTDRRVIRVDPPSLDLVDARSIEQPRSLRLPFGSIVAAAKTPPPRPSVQIASDGRTAYVVPWPAAAPWRPGISVIDIASAAVRASYLSDREIWGIQLSADGSRLFVLDGSGYTTGAPVLLVIESATGSVVTTIALDRPALALIAP
jgi:hypothetical protein